MVQSNESRTTGVYAVIAGDPFVRGEALRGLLKELPGGAELAPLRVDGERVELADVLDELRTPSLLGDRRVVIVDGADEFIKLHREALERYCGSPSECGTLILLCDSLPRTTRLFRSLAERGGILQPTTPKGRAVVEWAMARARDAYSKRLDRRAAERLHDYAGEGLGVIDVEVSKLATYVGSREAITADDVAELTTEVREEKVFAVTDAIASGDPSESLAAWGRVVATDPASPHRAVAGLAFGVRRLLEARRDWDAGANLHELARRLFTDLETARRRLEAVSVAELEAMQCDLLTADLAVKTGLTGTERAVEKFIVNHSAADAAGRRAVRKEASHGG